MPLYWKTKVVLAKLETVYGTDPVPTNVANAMLMSDVAFTPMAGTDVSRNLEYPFLGGQAEIPAALTARIEGSVEMAGSGAAGTAPKWAPLLRACGFSESINAGVSAVYTPVSAAMESVSLYFFIGGNRQIMTGCRGSFVITLNAQGIPVIRFTITGRWNAPAAMAAPVPTLTGFQKPVIASNTNTPVFTVNAQSLVMRSFTLDAANQVEPRLLVGSESIEIVDRAPLLSMAVEAVPLATFNPFTLAQNQTAVAVSLNHGTVAGHRVDVSCPTCQLKRLSGYQENQMVLEWPLEARPLPNAGNDEIAITVR
jgi:hypothetical protein